MGMNEAASVPEDCIDEYEVLGGVSVSRPVKFLEEQTYV
jgi:hypothetical protein